MNSTSIKYNLPAQQRLKSRKTIQQLFKQGKAFSIFPLRVVYITAESKNPQVQVGFSVSTKYFKKAVDRNRIKRLLKESYRLQKNNLRVNSSLQVFFIYTGNEIAEYKLLFSKVGNALTRLQKIIDEQYKSNP